MPGHHRLRVFQAQRRCWLLAAGMCCIAPHRLVRAAAYTATIAAMQTAHEAEMQIYYRYTEFGRRAAQDGYRGIAYLFTAFAAAELIHAGNFGRILARLNVEVPPVPKPTVKVGTTRENLIAAAESEMASIDSLYPGRIRAEGHADAIATVRYAWATEKQHRDKIAQIQRWSPTFFEQVAKQIDAKTGQYFICQLCGCTLNKLPAETCPVCANAAKHFRLVEPPT
jgi:rubrerythrin